MEEVNEVKGRLQRVEPLDPTPFRLIGIDLTEVSLVVGMAPVISSRGVPAMPRSNSSGMLGQFWGRNA